MGAGRMSLKRRLRDLLFPRHATISATVIRKDGRVEELGVISRGKITFKAEAK